VLPTCVGAAIAAGAQATEALAAAVDADRDALGRPLDRRNLCMLCYCRGRERTLDQLGELAKSAGLQVSSVMPARSRSIIELRPSH
jgi:2,7-dihydroxy-5-methyl-1-naphthoate 7-O-methyltransferase